VEAYALSKEALELPPGTFGMYEYNIGKKIRARVI